MEQLKLTIEQNKDLEKILFFLDHHKKAGLQFIHHLFESEPKIITKVSTLLDYLERKSLIRKNFSGNNRLVFITIEGEALVNEIKNKAKTIIKQDISDKIELNERDIFIVHGHDETKKETVARLISNINLNPIILNEQASVGHTIIEKLERSSNVGAAIILLTGDDLGGSCPDGLRKRARQNVILELGYFFGKIGRKRTITLYEEDIELPSDFHGINWILLDKNVSWKLTVVKELKAMGYNVSADNI